MNDYLDKPTLADRLAGYLESDDLAADMAELENEYSYSKQSMPSTEQLRAEVIAQKREWLEHLAICETEGHQLKETADGENGTSELDCDRCGMTFHCQW